MIIAWLKLRQRNLGPILDANGWAVNGRVKMNVPFGGALTDVAALPAGAQPSFAVRYPEPPTALPKFIFTIVIICFIYSLLAHFKVLPQIGVKKADSSTSGTNAPAAVIPDTNAPAAK